MAMEMGILWGDWIAQPPQHRALYLATQEARGKMDRVDDGERAMKSYKKDRQ